MEEGVEEEEEEAMMEKLGVANSPTPDVLALDALDVEVDAEGRPFCEGIDFTIMVPAGYVTCSSEDDVATDTGTGGCMGACAAALLFDACTAFDPLLGARKGNGAC